MSRAAPATEAEVVDRVRAARAAGRRVVFTNGAFDLFHAGHLALLEAAAGLGDVLVVGVNADATVRRAKGARRPVVVAAERARIVGALDVVDHAFVFDDDTVDRLLETLHPDVHAKGPDYDAATLPERGTNARLGIEMAFVGPAKERASSSIVARAAAAGAGAFDVVVSLGDADHDGFVSRRLRARLAAEGWLDLEQLVETDEGELLASDGSRVLRRLEMAGVPVQLETASPFDKKHSPILAFQNHLAVRAAGLRAPEPWLAIEGRGRVGALVVRQPDGVRLDRWVETRLASRSPRERLHAAYGVGRALRAFHTARFVSDDTAASRWIVHGDPALGAAALTFLGLARLERPSGRVGPRQGAKALRALAASLEDAVPARLRLAALRGYLGGSLRSARLWLARL